MFFFSLLYVAGPMPLIFFRSFNNLNPEFTFLKFIIFLAVLLPTPLSFCNSKIFAVLMQIRLSLFIFFRAGYLSDSEAELDGEHNEVVLPQHVSSRGNIKSTKSAIRCVA